jgi:hypothetical protein
LRKAEGDVWRRDFEDSVIDTGCGFEWQRRQTIWEWADGIGRGARGSEREGGTQGQEERALLARAPLPTKPENELSKTG